MKKITGQIRIEEIDNGNEDVLKLKLTDSKGKYKVTKLYYRLGSFRSDRDSVETNEENGAVFANLDVSELPYGEYKAYFRFEAIMIKKNVGRGKKLGHSKPHTLLGYATFEKIQLQKVFVSFTFEHEENSPSVNILAGETYSEAGEIASYIYNIYKNGQLVDTVESEVPELIYSFKEPGEFELEVIATDELDNSEASERQNVTITNSAPTLVYNLTSREGLQGHYNIDFTGSHDKDGQNIKYYRLLIDYEENGESFNQGDLVWRVPTINFAAPESGRDYTLTIVVYDDDLNYTYEEVPFRYDGDIAPKYNYHYIADDEFVPHVKYIGAEFLDGDGMQSFHYKATHEDGTVVYPWDDTSAQHTGIELPKPGLWTFEFYGVDNTGLKSDVATETREIIWEASDLKPVFGDCYFEPREEDPRVYSISCGFEDPLGEIVSYKYSATHEDGTQLQEQFENEHWNELWFSKKGNWTIEVTATDNDGFSTTHTWMQDIQWEFETPVADLEIVQDAGNPYLFAVQANNSTPKNIKRFHVKVLHESGLFFDFESETMWFNFELSKRGNWTVEYSVEDFFGLTSEVSTYDIYLAPIVVNASISKSDPNLFSLDPSGSYDPLFPLGNISFRLRGTNKSGQVIDYIHYMGISHFELEPGEWALEVSGIDPMGRESGSFIKTVTVENQAPELVFQLMPINPPLRYKIDASASYSSFGTIAAFDVIIKKDGNNFAAFTSEESIFDIPTLNQNGDYLIQVIAIGDNGQKSDIKSTSVQVNLPSVDEDVLPPHPGEEGKLTLSGVDWDEDGVRDDIEHFINDFVENPNLPIRRKLIGFSRNFSSLILQNDLEEIHKTFQAFIDVNHCMEASYGEKDGEIIYQEILLAHINTDERFQAYLESRTKMFGRTFDLNKEVVCE